MADVLQINLKNKTSNSRNFTAEEAAEVPDIESLKNKAKLSIDRQAEKERLINDITNKIQNTVTVENALQVAIEELGRAFKAPYTKVKLGTISEATTNGSHEQA